MASLHEAAGRKPQHRERERPDMADELSELAFQYQVKLSDKTRDDVDRNYWSTLKKLLKKVSGPAVMPAGPVLAACLALAPALARAFFHGYGREYQQTTLSLSLSIS